MNVVRNILNAEKRRIVQAVMRAPKRATRVPSVPRLRLHAAQAKILSERRRFNVAVCGRRFGKTALSHEILWECIERGSPCAYFAPTYKMLSLVWKEAKSRFFPAIEKINVQEKRLEFLGGGSLDFWSLDAFDSVRGRKYALAVIDEAAMFKNLEEAWLQAIRPTLTDCVGSAWFFSTPKGMNYFRVLAEMPSTSELWATWQMPTAANPYIDPAEIESARRELPELVFQQEYLAQFVETQGATIKREYIRKSELPPHLEYYMGVDLAISTKSSADYTAIAVLARDEDGRVYICDVARTRLGFHAAMQWIIAYADKWRPQIIAVESTQYQAAAVQELLLNSTHTIQGIRSKKDKVTRFMGLQARYEQGLVYHAPHIGDEFERELLAFPHGEHDDMIDAAAYAYNIIPHHYDAYEQDSGVVFAREKVAGADDA